MNSARAAERTLAQLLKPRFATQGYDWRSSAGELVRRLRPDGYLDLVGLSCAWYRTEGLLSVSIGTHVPPIEEFAARHGLRGTGPRCHFRVDLAGFRPQPLDGTRSRRSGIKFLRDADPGALADELWDIYARHADPVLRGLHSPQAYLDASQLYEYPRMVGFWHVCALGVMSRAGEAEKLLRTLMYDHEAALAMRHEPIFPHSEYFWPAGESMLREFRAHAE